MQLLYLWVEQPKCGGILRTVIHSLDGAGAAPVTDARQRDAGTFIANASSKHARVHNVPMVILSWSHLCMTLLVSVRWASTSKTSTSPDGVSW